LYTSELQTDSYTILHPDNTVVCQVRTSRASVKDEDLDEDDEATTDEATAGAPADAAAENASEAQAEAPQE